MKPPRNLLPSKFRKSDRVFPHPEPKSFSLVAESQTKARTVNPADVGQSLGTVPDRVRAALGGGYSGNQISNHREEALHNEAFSYIAIDGIGMQLHAATVSAYFDGKKKDQNVSQRKSLKLTFGSKWKALYGSQEKDDLILDTDHPLMRVLTNPNPYEPGGIFRYRQVQQARLTGSAYMWNVPNALGKTCQRYVIPTTAITPVFPTAQLPFGGYRVQPNCMRAVAFDDEGYINGIPALMYVLGYVIDARFVQKVGYPHPVYLDDFQSPMSAGSLWVDSERAINEARANGVSRGLDPSIHVQLPDSYASAPSDELNRIRLQYGKEYGGPHNVGKPLVTIPGTTITQLGLTPKDMGYSEGFQDMKAALLALHKTPPVAIGLQDGGSYAANNASLRQWGHTAIKPMCDFLAESDTFHLAPQFGEGITVEIDPEPVNDEAETNARVQIAISARSITKNTVNATLGFEPLDGPEGEKLAGPDPAQKKPGELGSDPAASSGGPDETTPPIPKAPSVDQPFSRDDMSTMSKSLLAVLEGRNEADDEFISEKLEQMVQQRVESIMKARDPAKPRKFSSTQINLPAELAERIMEFGKIIPDDKLVEAEGGREDKIHATALFGLHTNNPKVVENAVSSFGPVRIMLGPLSYFECNGYDVLKIDVISPRLIQLHETLADACEHTSTHPDYIPHITIGYVEKGFAKQFAGNPIFSGEEFTARELYFSGQNGIKRMIPLAGTFAESMTTAKEPIQSTQPIAETKSLKGSSPIPAIQKAGKELAESGRGMPGYGDIYVKENGSGEVWYVGGDGDESGFSKTVVQKLTAVAGIDDVYYGSEHFPPDDGTWMQVYPEVKEPRTKSLGMSTDIGGNGGMTVPSETADPLIERNDSCPPCPKCSSKNTGHCRTDGSGNARCSDCVEIFTDPNYGKRSDSVVKSHSVEGEKRDESGKWSAGASSASNAAKVATESAETKPSKANHVRARSAHIAARDIHGDEGNSDQSDYHNEMANHHGKEYLRPSHPSAATSQKPKESSGIESKIESAISDWTNDSSHGPGHLISMPELHQKISQNGESIEQMHNALTNMEKQGKIRVTSYGGSQHDLQQSGNQRFQMPLRNQNDPTSGGFYIQKESGKSTTKSHSVEGESRDEKGKWSSEGAAHASAKKVNAALTEHGLEPKAFVRPAKDNSGTHVIDHPDIGPISAHFGNDVLAKHVETEKHNEILNKHGIDEKAKLDIHKFGGGGGMIESSHEHEGLEDADKESDEANDILERYGHSPDATIERNEDEEFASTIDPTPLKELDEHIQKTNSRLESMGMDPNVGMEWDGEDATPTHDLDEINTALDTLAMFKKKKSFAGKESRAKYLSAMEMLRPFCGSEIEIVKESTLKSSVPEDPFAEFNTRLKENGFDGKFDHDHDQSEVESALSTFEEFKKNKSVGKSRRYKLAKLVLEPFDLKSYSATEERASDGKWTNGSSHIQAAGAAKASERAHEFTKITASGHSPAVKLSSTAKERIPKNGKLHGTTEATAEHHEQSASDHDKLAEIHQKVSDAATARDDKESHGSASRAHRSASVAHKRAAEQIRNWANPKAVTKGWITLKPHGEDGDSYVHVLVDGDGKIMAGPKGMEGKNVSHLDKTHEKIGEESKTKPKNDESAKEVLTKDSNVDNIGPVAANDGTKLSRSEPKTEKPKMNSEKIDAISSSMNADFVAVELRAASRNTDEQEELLASRTRKEQSLRRSYEKAVARNPKEPKYWEADKKKADEAKQKVDEAHQKLGESREIVSACNRRLETLANMPDSDFS